MTNRRPAGAGSGARARASRAASWRGPSGPRHPRYPLGVAFRTALSRRRRLLAAVLLAAAAAIAVLQLSPSQQATVPVVVATHALGAGTVLSHDDLRVAHYPEELVPATADRTGAGAGALPAGTATGTPRAVSAPSPPTASPEDPSDPAADWVGRTLSAAVVEGQPLTAASVLGPDLLAGQPPGTTAVTIRVADPGTLTHLRPGQRVDLILREDGSGSAVSPTETSPDDASPASGDSTGNEDDGSAQEEEAGSTGSPDEPTTGGNGPGAATAGASGRAGAGLPVLWVADPVEPTGGLLESTGGVEDDLLVVGADEATAARIAASAEGQLVPVLVAPAEGTDRP